MSASPPVPSWTRDTEISCLFADYWWSPMWSNNVVNMNLSTVHRTKSLCDDGGRKVARMKTMLGPNLLMSPTVGAQHGALSRLSVTSHNNWYSNKIYKRVDTCSCPWLLFSGLRWFTFNVLLYMYLSILATCGQNKSNILTCWWLMCKHPN